MHMQTLRKYYFTPEIITWAIPNVKYITRGLCNQTCACTGKKKLQSHRGQRYLDEFASEDEEAAFL